METIPQIFLSYARQDQDKDTVRELYQRRLSAAGFKPRMDQEDIYPGEQWQASIERAIEQSDFFLACLLTHAIREHAVPRLCDLPPAASPETTQRDILPV